MAAFPIENSNAISKISAGKVGKHPKKRGSDLIGCYFLKVFYSAVEILQTASEFFKNSKEIAEAIRNTSEFRCHLLFASKKIQTFNGYSSRVYVRILIRIANGFA